MGERHASDSGRPAHAMVNTRVFSSPREAVFGAFSDPIQLARWWGPAGFTNTFHEFDFRAGGRWRFTMRGPDGVAYELEKAFAEIVPPSRIVLRHVQQGHDFSLIMTLIARDGGTEVVWDMRFDDPAEAERRRAFLVPANEQNLDRLAAHLSGGQGFVR